MKHVSIKRTTFIIMAFTFISYLLGFARESFIAYQFGATGLTDSFYVAAIVPDMVAGIIANALTNAFVPILKREKHAQNGSPQSLVNLFVLYATVLSTLLAVITYLLRGSLIHLLAPGFNRMEYIEAKTLLTIMCISVFFSALSGVMWGIYNVNESYLFPAMINVVSNTLMLLTVAVFAKTLGVDSLGYGLTIGMIGKFCVQFIPLLYQRQIRLPRGFWHPAIKDILWLLPPTLVSIGLGSLNLIVDRVLASTLPGGQLTDLNFASKLGFLPPGLIGVSIATTLYTRFVTHTLQDQPQALRSLIHTTMSWIVFLGIAIGACFNFFSIDVISLLYHHGAFSNHDVILASGPLRVYGWFLTFYLMQPIVVRFFYARRDNRFVMFASLGAVGANILISVLMVRPLGILGLALGNSISQLVFVSYLVVMMGKRLKWSMLQMIGSVIWKSAPPALAFMAGCSVTGFIWTVPNSVPLIWHLVRDAVMLLSGLCILGVVALRQRRGHLKAV